MELCAHQSYAPNFLLQQQLNIDYNSSSATAKTSFHGTGISLIQHSSHAFKGYSHDLPVINKTTIATLSSLSHSTATLPVKYTNVLPASIKSKEFTAPMVDGSHVIGGVGGVCSPHDKATNSKSL